MQVNKEKTMNYSPDNETLSGILLEERMQLDAQMVPISNRIKEINEELITHCLSQIKEYLVGNKIDEDSYTLKGHMYTERSLTLFLERDSEYHIDEDFESDMDFDDFLEDTAKCYGFRYIGVPSYYYPK